MNALLLVVALAAWLAAMGVLSLAAATSEAATRRNIGTLADRYGLDQDTAARLYARAREVGFASAYREVVRRNG